MSWPEILDRSAIEVLLDHGWTDVARTCDGRCIPQAFADASHDGCHPALRLGLGVGDAALRESDGCGERAAPRAEVLGGELLAHVDADVVVQVLAREVVEVALPLVPEEPPAAGEIEELLDRLGQLGVDDARSHLYAVLPPEIDGDAMPAHTHVPFCQRRDP